MIILGQGHKGIVIESGTNTVKKFYKSKQEWENEKANLIFLAKIKKQGFAIGCKIPEVIYSTDRGTCEIEGQTYHYSSTMERVAGVTASSNFLGKDLATLGTHLGTILWNMHANLRSCKASWTSVIFDKSSASAQQDALLMHILNDKAAKVVKEEADREAVRFTKTTMRYLEKHMPLLIPEQGLSHLDLNLNNILVAQDNTIEGLVDWGGFGLTNPSLSLYQLATKPDLWQHIQRQYKKLGGVIDLDIVYAAATIHLAWAPIICREVNQPLDEHETREGLKEIYAYFNVHKNSCPIVRPTYCI